MMLMMHFCMQYYALAAQAQSESVRDTVASYSAADPFKLLTA
jgi:hypothetical protein